MGGGGISILRIEISSHIRGWRVKGKEISYFTQVFVPMFHTNNNTRKKKETRNLEVLFFHG